MVNVVDIIFYEIWQCVLSWALVLNTTRGVSSANWRCFPTQLENQFLFLTSAVNTPDFVSCCLLLSHSVSLSLSLPPSLSPSLSLFSPFLIHSHTLALSSFSSLSRIASPICVLRPLYLYSQVAWCERDGSEDLLKLEAMRNTNDVSQTFCVALCCIMMMFCLYRAHICLMADKRML